MAVTASTSASRVRISALCSNAVSLAEACSTRFYGSPARPGSCTLALESIG